VTQPVRVVVWSGDPLARSGLAALLADDPSIVVLTAAGEPGTPAVALAPEVVVWDVGLDGAEPAPPSRGVGAAARLLALVADAEQAAAARAAGAQGILERDAGSRRLSAAVHALVAGLVVLDDQSATGLLRPAAREVAAPAEALTPRENEVLQLLATGASNKEIAARLGISEHTAKFHVAKVLQKLGAESRSEAVFIAAKSGLLLL
jgi:DNA-binding NarL/FixJ family response regulator